MKTILGELIDALEMRRMAVAEYKATWCDCCYLCSLKDPKARNSFVLMCSGDLECRQPIKSGTISECIAYLKEAQSLAAGNAIQRS